MRNLFLLTVFISTCFVHAAEQTNTSQLISSKETNSIIAFKRVCNSLGLSTHDAINIDRLKLDQQTWPANKRSYVEMLQELLENPDIQKLQVEMRQLGLQNPSDPKYAILNNDEAAKRDELLRKLQQKRRK